MDNEISISQDHEMRLGKMEFLAMNNPVRRAIQKHVEFKIFRELLQRKCIEKYGNDYMLYKKRVGKCIPKI